MAIKYLIFTSVPEWASDLILWATWTQMPGQLGLTPRTTLQLKSFLLHQNRGILCFRSLAPYKGIQPIHSN